MARKSQFFRNIFLNIAIAIALLLSLLSSGILEAKPTWFQKVSRNFTIIYRQPQAYLVPHIIESAEKSLAKLSGIFHYTPAQKITIATFDFADHGTAGATTVPHNIIRLEIEPFESGYEFMPYHDRIQWLMDHELVHIIVNDQASKAETASRSLFARVMPVQEQPLSVGYSLLTNFNRYSPRWHQEGIATFLETWLTGGYGRGLGNFDEMYFRAIVNEGKAFASPAELDAKSTKESFLLGSLYYLYGTRFMSWLAAEHGVEKLIAWFQLEDGEIYQGYEKKFQHIYGLRLEAAWNKFVQSEKQFQQENLARLAAAPRTSLRHVSGEAFGWVSQPYLHASGSQIVFGQHRSHRLTAITLLDLATGSTKTIGSLPSPSILHIASTAYDPKLGLFFYTTNNNQFFRDLHVLDVATGKSKMLFEDVRVGQLTVSPQTHELWGIRHHNGRAALVYSPFPYNKILPVIEFEYGDELQHLAVSPSGDRLATTLHQASGKQSIVVADVTILKSQGRFVFRTITEDGSPEFPSWSPDGQYLYWNAYTNGVSNIYRAENDISQLPSEGTVHPRDAKIEAMSHTLTGLFRPLFVSDDSLFAFAFTSDGFRPVMCANRPADHLPAIAYFGQHVIDRNPEIAQWSEPGTEKIQETTIEDEATYSGLSGLKLQTLIPVVSGFQHRQVYGVYAHLADPLNTQTMTIDLGISPGGKHFGTDNIHLRATYDYRKRYRVGIEHNAASFYDLSNARKSSLSGTKFMVGHTRYWKYDNPHKMTQRTDLSFYTGLESFNDNTIAVSIRHFAMLETQLESKNTRRAIGSVDSEAGSEWAVTLSAFGYNANRLQIDGGLHGEWGVFRTVGLPHNVLHLKLTGGYRFTNKDFGISHFFLGGFGNRYLEDRAVKQYRQATHFPGLPVYSLASNHFAKVMLEHNLPPLRISGLGWGQHHLSHIDASWFTQGLVTDFRKNGRWINLGAQINFVFEHWFNLESTFSAGVARAWDGSGQQATEWFISYKLLRN